MGSAVGGNQARLDVRTEFEILQRSPKGWKVVVHIPVRRRGAGIALDATKDANRNPHTKSVGARVRDQRRDQRRD